jgi:hypothetical protein
MRDRVYENYTAMAGFDWCTLWLAAGFLGMVSAGENKDVKLCTMIIDRAEGLSLQWSIALKLIGGVRRWVFLPGMLVSVAALVVLQGGVSPSA